MFLVADANVEDDEDDEDDDASIAVALYLILSGIQESMEERSLSVTEVLVGSQGSTPGSTSLRRSGRYLMGVGEGRGDRGDRGVNGVKGGC